MEKYKIKILNDDELDLENEDIVSAIKTVAEYIRVWPDVDQESGYAMSFMLGILHQAIRVNEIELPTELEDKIYDLMVDKSKDN